MYGKFFRQLQYIIFFVNYNVITVIYGIIWAFF